MTRDLYKVEMWVINGFNNTYYSGKLRIAAQRPLSMTDGQALREKTDEGIVPEID